MQRICQAENESLWKNILTNIKHKCKKYKYISVLSHIELINLHSVWIAPNKHDCTQFSINRVCFLRGY